MPGLVWLNYGLLGSGQLTSRDDAAELSELTCSARCDRPPGPAWLRRFKQKFRLVGTSHWTQVTGMDYWTGLAPWGCGILGDGVSLTANDEHETASLA